MTNRFEYTAPDGRYLRAADREESGVWVVTSEFGCLIPRDRVEEVVAGLRDMARQTGGQAEPVRCTCARSWNLHSRDCARYVDGHELINPDSRGREAEPVVVRLDTSSTDFKDLIRRIIGNGPTGSAR